MVEEIMVSLLRFCRDFSDSLGLQLHVENLDNHLSDETWPETDFIGPSEVEVQLHEGGVTLMQGTIVLSTRDDLNMFRLNKNISLLAKRMEPNMNFKVLHAETGALIGKAAFQSPTVVTPPMVGSKSQPIRAIAFRAALTVLRP